MSTRSSREAGRAACTRCTSADRTELRFRPPCRFAGPQRQRERCCGWIPGISTPSWSSASTSMYRQSAFGLKILAGAAGITGSKSKGIEDLRDAGAHGVITSVEARTALGLFLRREAKYDEAIAVTRSLTEEYPRDFLFRLELANLTKDAGQGKAAIAEYQQLLGRPRSQGISLQPIWNLPGSVSPTPCRGKKLCRSRRGLQPGHRCSRPSAWISKVAAISTQGRCMIF
jgi:hypothetical protein